jgi:hypothetical protein
VAYLDMFLLHYMEESEQNDLHCHERWIVSGVCSKPELLEINQCTAFAVSHSAKCDVNV